MLCKYRSVQLEDWQSRTCSAHRVWAASQGEVLVAKLCLVLLHQRKRFSLSTCFQADMMATWLSCFAYAQHQVPKLQGEVLTGDMSSLGFICKE